MSDRSPASQEKVGEPAGVRPPSDLSGSATGGLTHRQDFGRELSGGGEPDAAVLPGGGGGVGGAGSPGGSAGQERTAEAVSGQTRSFDPTDAADPASNEQQDAMRAQAKAQSQQDAGDGELDDKRGQSDLGGMNTTDGM